MATYTSYLNLEKPTTSETFNLLKMNQNWDKIDAGVSALNSKIQNFSIDKAESIPVNQDYSFTLVNNAAYLLMTAKPLNSDIGSTLYIVRAYSSSTTLTAIRSSGNVVVSADGLTLTIRPDTQYVGAYLIRIN